MPRKIYDTRLLSTESLSDQTKHLVFEVENEERFDFAPGQFVSMLAPKDGKTITRAYSIASAPRSNQLDIEELAQKNPKFHYLITISRPSENWQGERGYVQEHVKKIMLARPPELRIHMDAYICGLNDMVSANRKLLTEEFGWDKKQVIFERYD